MSRISIQEIVTELINRGTGFNYGKPKWREKRRERCRIYLTKLGTKLGFDVFPHATRKRPQYMVDFCWLSLQTKRWSIELAVEMEWDPHSCDVVYDFSKLVNIKAPRKIMLCAPFPSHRSDDLKQMTETVRRPAPTPPRPAEEDPWYKWAYDKKYGKGAYERDLALRKSNEVTTGNEVKVSHDFFEVVSPFKHYWNSEHNVGILERNGKYIGVCVLAAKEIVDRESFVRKFGLDQRLK